MYLNVQVYSRYTSIHRVCLYLLLVRILVRVYLCLITRIYVRVVVELIYMYINKQTSSARHIGALKSCAICLTTFLRSWTRVVISALSDVTQYDEAEKVRVDIRTCAAFRQIYK
jgi:hypothetical protein